MKTIKKAVILLLLVSIISTVISINSCENKNQDYTYSIKDALKISAWVLDESRDENGYWIEDTEYINRSFWFENDGTIIDSAEDDVFVEEPLKLNDVRIMVPMGHFTPDINIYCEFDGIIEADTDDEYIRLANRSNPNDTIMEHKNVRQPYKLHVEVCPLDRYYSPLETYVMLSSTKLGKEYSLNINAYRFDNEESPIIRAKLKFVVLEDKSSPDSPDYAELSPKGYSRFLSVELVSYEYSDSYIILDELWDEE